MSYQKSQMGGLRPTQPLDRNTRTTPVSHARTLRYDDLSCVTSTFGGKFLPVAAVPLLREDRALNSMINVNFQMAETADMLLNPVRASVSAWLVPKMAFSRFSGWDSINRSYNGQTEIDDSVIPWFEVWAPGVDDELMKAMGIHLAANDAANTDYVEAYNAIWNHIAKNMSKDIALRDDFDSTIAPAFWDHTQLKYVKATFDDVMMEGQVPITITQGEQMKVFAQPDFTNKPGMYSADDPDSNNKLLVHDSGNAASFFWTELQAEGVQLTLANIDLARETAAWARLRSEYQHLDEDWMMDQLLSGIAMPEEAMKQPILLDRQTVPFGMIQRYATDGASLEQSATNGQTGATLRIRTPQINTGGVIMICAQCLPEMVYERQRDYYLMAKAVSELPQRTQDELDPQPVVEIFNQEVDELHTMPNEVFGYAPLNHQWMRAKPKIGGKYYRDDPTGPWSENRTRIWDTSTVDPKLGEDFYLATNIRHDVFKSQNSDPFEVWASGRVAIEGLTYFGPALRESTNDYEKVLEQVDTTRIDPPDVTVQDAKNSD